MMIRDIIQYISYGSLLYVPGSSMFVPVSGNLTGMYVSYVVIVVTVSYCLKVSYGTCGTVP